MTNDHARPTPSLALAALLCAVAAAMPNAQTPTGGNPKGRGLTQVQGLKVGHFTMKGRPTGCTVVLAPDNTTGGVDVRGGSPGTRETDLLDPVNNVQIVNALVLAGGSAFGLEAATGTVRYLEEQGIGYDTRVAKVPIVPAAILFDLAFGGDAKIRPDADCGYQAAKAAHDGPVGEGNVGAGAGATVGKMGMGRSMKAGVGSAAIVHPDGLVVAALVAVNAVGDIIDPSTGRVIAGVRTEDGTGLADARTLVRAGRRPQAAPRPGENTTIGIVATNAKLTKVEAQKIAQMAHDGYARAISPVHTPGDGDTIFSLATGSWTGEVNLSTVGALAAEAMADAIVRAAITADSSSGVPSARSLGTVPERLRE